MAEMGKNILAGKTRLDILKASFSAGKTGAHIAPSLSLVDICLAVLLRFDSVNDCFILSKGHGALGYYAAMHQLGIITDEQFLSFEQDGGDFPGQPSRSRTNHINYSSGSLGMGLSYGLGVAIAKRKGKVFVVLGDGELNEGSNWEAASLARRYGLDNLIAIVDNNSLQSDGFCNDIQGQELVAIWKAYGWYTVECDGHNIDELSSTLSCAHPNKPLVILAKTITGKGVSFMENNNAWHHASIKESELNDAVRQLEINYGLC